VPDTNLDSTAALYTALAAAQAELGGVAVDASNNYGKYATLAAVLATVLPVFSRHGLAVVQLLSDGDGGRVCVTTRICHQSGGSIESSLSGKPARDTPQGQGSTITYLRRYALMAVAGVAPVDDDGQAAEPEQGGLSIEEARRLLDVRGLSLEAVDAALEAKNRPPLEALSNAKRAAAVDWLSSPAGRAVLEEVSRG
jgi:hypothetical protein